MQSFSKAVLLLLPVLILRAADPPPEVDLALRERVQQFYQLEVDGKYRQAEPLVAEDSKDFYYASKKPDIREFRIEAIQYAPDFQSADVTLMSKVSILIPGIPPTVLDVPFHAKWKIDDGKWCWYVDKSALLDTPFGRIQSPSQGASDGKLPQPDSRVTVADIQSGVKADKERLRLDTVHPKPATITLKNTLPGPVTIQVITQSPALKIVLAKANLAGGESTEVTATYVEGNGPPPDKIRLFVQPTGQYIQIDIDAAK